MLTVISLVVDTCFRIAHRFSGDRGFWVSARRYYFKETNHLLSYKRPKLLREKLMWLTRYWRSPLKTICADKLVVRDYVKSKGLADILVPILGQYDSPEEIDFSLLPESYVLKCNHGCGFNIIVPDTHAVSYDRIRKKLGSLLEVDYCSLYFELHYRDIRRKIICEKMISITPPTEYQFWCVNGEPQSILACKKNHDGTYDAYSYSTSWEQLFDRVGEKPDVVLQKPEKLDVMLDYCRILSADFPFVRVDFYEVEANIYFAELTFTPDSNLLRKYKHVFHVRMGDKLVLPEKLV